MEKRHLGRFSLHVKRNTQKCRRRRHFQCLYPLPLLSVPMMYFVVPTKPLLPFLTLILFSSARTPAGWYLRLPLWLLYLASLWILGVCVSFFFACMLSSTSPSLSSFPFAQVSHFCFPCEERHPPVMRTSVCVGVWVCVCDGFCLALLFFCISPFMFFSF